MTLRAKLIAAFGTTLILSILVFSLITYLTFAQDKIADKEEIFRLRAEVVLASIRSATERALLDSLPHQTIVPPRDRDDGLGDTSAADSPDPPSGETPLLTLVQILPWPKDSTPVDMLNAYQVKARNLHVATSGPTFFHNQDQIYLLWPWGKPGMPDHLYILRCDKPALQKLIAQRAATQQLMLRIWLDGEIFQTIDRLDQQSPAQTAAASEFMNQPVTGKGHFVGGRDFHLFAPTQSLMGLQFRYLIPNTDLFHSTIAFKNRIITALIVLGWASIWIVLIIAYRITKPLGILDQAAQDIISYNYETPLTLSGGGREVKSLAASFETMRQKIKELVVQDTLTQLYNRRYLMHALELAVAQAERNHEPLTCIMIDIDNFKAINDQYGHQAGDEVLRSLGGLMQSCTREYDIAARYGGEEFTLVLPKTEPQTAQQVAERIRRTVEKYPFTFSEQQMACTISLGIASFIAESDSPDTLMGRADRALYQAKQQGRNRTISL
ncbi:GGDEF domain-containing protein [Geopsychrobacter electrodiphilus]|uniref:GGDEF domain-containing protein n=1 Tax=Geopsychrobacter electrodiphilus TaxID=225196 RepID=UPI00036B01E6|nr:sensor domain-containing diguanylate cyclase [Geopsychrobacter electrodiphilus]